MNINVILIITKSQLLNLILKVSLNISDMIYIPKERGLNNLREMTN